MQYVGTKQTEQKIEGDRDKLLPECFALSEGLIGIPTLSLLSTPSNGLAL
jgi:hypothetical protein